MNSRAPYLSVVVPVYNEEQRIGNINKIVQYLSRQKFSFELIIVNDGSTDKTRVLIEKYKDRSVKAISYLPNHGKGYAIKQGMLAAKGQHRLFLDIDLATPIEEIDHFLPFTDQFDCLVGTRKAAGAKIINHQPWLRENLGKCFTLLSQIVLGVFVSDFTCGFKIFSANCAQNVFGASRINRWGFDSEILFLCRRFGYSIKELPVTWRDDARTRVKFPQDIVRSLQELLAIRINALRGLYHYEKNTRS